MTFDRPRVERLVPQAHELVDVRGALATVRAGDRDGREDRGAGDLGESGKLRAFERGAAQLAGAPACGRELVHTSVRAHPGRDRDAVRQPAPRLAGVRAVHHQLHDPGREPRQDHLDQGSCQLGLRRPLAVKLRACLVLGFEQPEQDGQTDHPTAETRKLDDEHDHDPTVPPTRPLPGPLGLGAVVQVVRAEHLAPRAPEQRVIDREADRRVPPGEHHDHEIQQRQPDPVGIPATPREEVMRTTVMPAAREPRRLQHPRHRAIPHPAREPDQQHAERLERRLGKASPQQGQQSSERTGNLTHGGDPPMSRPRTARQRPAADGLVAHRIRGRRQPSFNLGCSGFSVGSTGCAGVDAAGSRATFGRRRGSQAQYDRAAKGRRWLGDP